MWVGDDSERRRFNCDRKDIGFDLSRHHVLTRKSSVLIEFELKAFTAACEMHLSLQLQNVSAASPLLRQRLAVNVYSIANEKTRQ